MAVVDAKQAFTKRLKAALDKAGIEPRPAVVAREFNRRFLGKPVSTGAVRKWLTGESIPLQDKLVVLARRAGVSSEWLRYGATNPTPATQLQEAVAAFESEDLEFFRSYRELEPRYQLAVREVALALLRAQTRDAG